MSSYNSSIAGMNLSQSQSQGKQETVQGYYEINYKAPGTRYRNFNVYR